MAAAVSVLRRYADARGCKLLVEVFSLLTRTSCTPSFDAVRSNPGPFVACLALTLLQLLWCGVWTVAVLGAVSAASSGLIVVPMLLSLYWGVQVRL